MGKGRVGGKHRSEKKQKEETSLVLEGRGIPFAIKSGETGGKKCTEKGEQEGGKTSPFEWAGL